MTYFLIYSANLSKYSVQVPELHQWSGWFLTQAEALSNSKLLSSRGWASSTETLADFRVRFTESICFEFTELSNPEFFI